MRVKSVGHAVFAVTLVGLGVVDLTMGGFNPVWAPVPKGMSAQTVIAFLGAFISLACGIGLLWQRTAAIAARVLLIWLLLLLLLLRMRDIVRAPTRQEPWSGWAETAVMVAAAWVLYAWFATDWDRQRLGFACGDKGLRIARVLYGLALLPFGTAHFVYLKETAGLVPPWLPAHVAWAYFTGGAFIAAGLAVLFGVCARLAATLSAWQLGLFTFLVWLPRVPAGSTSAVVWSETIISWAITAAAWVVANSYRDLPWLARTRLNALA